MQQRDRRVAALLAMTNWVRVSPDDILTSDAMPGVAIDLGPIFARIRGAVLPDR